MTAWPSFMYNCIAIIVLFNGYPIAICEDTQEADGGGGKGLDAEMQSVHSNSSPYYMMLSNKFAAYLGELHIR